MIINVFGLMHTIAFTLALVDIEEVMIFCWFSIWPNKEFNFYLRE